MTTLVGADAAGHPTGAALKAAKIDALGIYLTNHGETEAHLLDLTNNGRWIWAIYEVAAQAAAGGKAAGQRDGALALAAAEALKIPKGAVLYPACDTDGVPYATVAQYWAGTRAEIEPAGYKNGGYGPHAYCQSALTQKIIDAAFVSGGWENGQPETNMAIKQLVAQRDVGGVTCDEDTILLPSSAGLFNLHGLYVAPAPPKPTPAPSPKPAPKPITMDQYATLHDMVHVDYAEAELAVHHKPEIAWYEWNGTTMVGHSDFNVPKGHNDLFGFRVVLDQAHIPHAGA